MNSQENGFHGLGLAPGILDILKKMGFEAPTPIQAQAIPPALEAKDIIGIAQTGTGKTLAFGLPVIQQVFQKEGLALVVTPTRELAEQVYEALGQVGAPLGLRAAKLIGGEPISKQLRQLARDPQVLIGTPGRIIDHLEQKKLSLKKLCVLVLDEADRMLDMGFAPQLKIILKAVPEERQTMLFSATMPQSIVHMANDFLKLPTRVEIARPGKPAEKVSQELFFVGQEEKPRLLNKILEDYKGSVLVFSRTKFGAKKITSRLKALGQTAAEIHSNRSLNQRREALEGFKKGKYRVLVATDIAARGIDVEDIEVVINYDLPDAAEDYVHRIGRTGRAAASGHAISFARPNERRDVQAIERLLQGSVPVSPLPELPPWPKDLDPVSPRESLQGYKKGRGGSGGQRGRTFRGKPKSKNPGYSSRGRKPRSKKPGRG